MATEMSQMAGWAAEEQRATPEQSSWWLVQPRSKSWWIAQPRVAGSTWRENGGRRRCGRRQQQQGGACSVGMVAAGAVQQQQKQTTTVAGEDHENNNGNNNDTQQQDMLRDARSGAVNASVDSAIKEMEELRLSCVSRRSRRWRR